MRKELLKPIRNKAKLAAVVKLTRELYRLHEAGQNYSKPLGQLGKLIGKPVSKFDVDAAFGSINPETFAEQLLFNPANIPSDLTEAEMLELVRRVCEADGREFQIEFWVECLRVNTGDERVCDLIFWPDLYFGDGNVTREMTPREILETARSAGEKSRAD